MSLPLPARSVRDPESQLNFEYIERNTSPSLEISTSLPLLPSVGDMTLLQADKINGVYWLLFYDGEGTYPWKKIGGPPLFTTGAGGEAKVETFAATGSASITMPAINSESLIEVGATSYNNTTNCYSQTGLKIGAGATEDILTHHQPSAGNAQHGGEASTFKKTLTSGIVIKTEIRQIGGGIAQIFSVWLKIDPIRVG